jgi:hypothetical protein
MPTAKPKSTSDSEQVTQHIQKLDASVRNTVQAIRESILSVDNEIGERIKWNNPSFYFTGEMKSFDPKEYKRDLIVFNLHKSRIMLVLLSGAKANDKSGLLEGDYKDGRRTIIFADIDDFKQKEKHLRVIIKELLKKIDE